MTYLFLDSTKDMIVGLLDENFKWLDYKRIESTKASQFIHGLIDELLSKNNLEVQKLEALFTVAGPGSYTGMRLSSGIEKIFSLAGIRTYSFYHYQVLEEFSNEGIFLMNAFKGEHFVYSWSIEKKENFLCKEEELAPILSQASSKQFTLEDAISILYQNPQILKTFEIKLVKMDVFYFRPLHEEFFIKK